MALVYAPGNAKMIKIALPRSISCLLTPNKFGFKLMVCGNKSTTQVDYRMMTGGWNIS